MEKSISAGLGGGRQRRLAQGSRVRSTQQPAAAHHRAPGLGPARNREQRASDRVAAKSAPTTSWRLLDHSRACVDALLCGSLGGGDSLLYGLVEPSSR